MIIDIEKQGYTVKTYRLDKKTIDKIDKYAKLYKLSKGDFVIALVELFEKLSYRIYFDKNKDGKIKLIFKEKGGDIY